MINNNTKSKAIQNTVPNCWNYPNIYKETYNLIKDLGCCEIKKDSPHYEFFHKLIYRHHRYIEKVGKGVRHFRIKKTVIDPSQYELQIKRRSNEDEINKYGKYKYESFDWYYCATGIKASDLTAASSRVIGCFRFAYKIKCRDEDGNWTCNYCNKITNSPKEIHSDHIYPQSKMLEDFCKNRNDVPVEFEKDPQSNETKFRNVDFGFHKDWVDYHTKHAKFQMLCKECNRKKGTKIIN